MSAEAVDVIVVGAGSAGAVLAARLSERAGRSVLLLEAGPDHSTSDTPSGVRSANFLRGVSEPGRTWPDLVAARSAGRPPSLYLRGRGVGGTSSINALMGIRGTPDDYDRWESEFGCEGWGWEAMRSAFVHLEDDQDYPDAPDHGRGGPIPLRRLTPQEMPPMDAALRSAMADLGYAVADDYHATGATGVSRTALTIRDGKRISVNDAYLEPARGRWNLDLRGGMWVDRLVLDGRSVGGVILVSGEVIEARQVVVCAGAIHSPAILLRSGVGVDDGLPVGANLREHAATSGFDLTLEPGARMPTADACLIGSMLRYSSGLADAGPNDMQLVWLGGVGPTDEDLGRGRIIGAAMRVFSRGRVALRSDDPRVDPIVDFDMLDDERDLVRLRDAVRRILDIVRHGAVRAIASDVAVPLTSIDSLDSDEAIDRWLVESVNDYLHAAGTCRMGSVGDPAAVVDASCRVIGYENLRVCDASVMPDIPKANTHLTTVAIAERLSGMM